MLIDTSALLAIVALLAVTYRIVRSLCAGECSD
jgi:hypothetical protein